jgi:hypothetical protein
MRSEVVSVAALNTIIIKIIVQLALLLRLIMCLKLWIDGKTLEVSPN